MWRTLHLQGPLQSPYSNLRVLDASTLFTLPVFILFFIERLLALRVLFYRTLPSIIWSCAYEVNTETTLLWYGLELGSDASCYLWVLGNCGGLCLSPRYLAGFDRGLILRQPGLSISSIDCTIRPACCFMSLAFSMSWLSVWVGQVLISGPTSLSNSCVLWW